MLAIDDKNLASLDAYFKQWQQLGERVRAQIAPALKVQEAVQESLRAAAEALEAWRIRLIESAKIPHFDLPEISFFAKQVFEFKESLQDLVRPALEQFHKSFRDLPPRTQEALLLLGDHGWFFDLEMPLPGLWELKEALSEGNIEEAEEALAEYFEDRLEDIEKSILGKFPHRAHLIKAAFNAHRRQEYELSIPVLLAQTDGICKEIVDQYLFRKRNQKPNTAIYVAQIAADTFRAALLSPLAETLPINASERERPVDSDALNRHTVLHGDSLDYGSKINSLKAISLVNYVSQVLEIEKETPSRTKGSTALDRN